MGRRKVITYGLDTAIVILAAVLAYGVYELLSDELARAVVWIFLAAGVAGVIVLEASSWSRRPVSAAKDTVIKDICLLSEDEKIIRRWNLSRKAGYVVGKSSGEFVADIDLSETAYAEYIDEAHLLLNYSESGWWAEDVSMRNGACVLRGGKELILAPDAPVNLQSGDTLLLAEHTRLLVK